MGKGRIVVIESDDWIARLLEDGLRAADYEVSVATDALDGFRRVCEMQPDCIICDVALPDFDGHWVARSVRSHPSAISKVPLLFLSNADDERSPLGAAEGSADAHLSKPFRLEEVVGQVAALMEMAKRLRETRPAANADNAPPAAGEALRGSLEQMSVATVMSLLELERRTGQLKVSNGGAEATIDLVRGFAIASTLRGISTPLLATVRKLLNWNKGLVSFYVGKDAPEPEKKSPIGALLMEAVQLNAMGPTTSIGYAYVYVQLFRYGHVERRLTVRCGKRFLSLGAPKAKGGEPTWFAASRSVDVPCGGSLEITMMPKWIP